MKVLSDIDEPIWRISIMLSLFTDFTFPRQERVEPMFKY
jgi:hypothetical protein